MFIHAVKTFKLLSIRLHISTVKLNLFIKQHEFTAILIFQLILISGC